MAGRLFLPFFGSVSSFAVDPIEKKPLYHFYPGSNILSIGFWGCSLKCPFCQNHTISQQTGRSMQTIKPSEIPGLVKKSGCSQAAFTYAEPLVHFEFIREAARVLAGCDQKTILVTNGYINPEPASLLLPYISAVNIDLKAFNNDFYTEMGGALEPVKEFIKAASVKTHTEITTLIVPGKNDSHAEIEDLARFLASLNPEIPLHLSAYHPAWKYTIAGTSEQSIVNLTLRARKYLKFVYPGNTHSLSSDTLCPECKNVVIERNGYNTKVTGLSGNLCTNCKKPVPVINAG